MVVIAALGANLACGTSASAQAISPAGAVAPAPQKTIWGFFGLSRGNLQSFQTGLASCRSKLGQTQLGSILGNTLKPVTLFSGGLIGGPKSPGTSTTPPGGPAAAPGAAPAAPGSAGPPISGPKGAQAASAKIQQYQADSKATIASIEYLATVDCHYWPEAEKALIDALRSNRVECVRLAAARAFEGGCCCSKRTIEALRIVVDGTEDDGNPSETSPRVRSTAFRALQRCLCSPAALTPGSAEEGPAPIEPPVPALPGPAAARGRSSGDTYYTDRLRSKDDRQVIATAWKSLATASSHAGSSPPLEIDGARTPGVGRRMNPGETTRTPHTSSPGPFKTGKTPPDRVKAASALNPLPGSRPLPQAKLSQDDLPTTIDPREVLILIPVSDRP